MKQGLKILSSIGLVTALVITVSYANRNHTPIELGDIAYNGTACPNKSVSITLTKDQNLRILFSQSKIQSKGRNKLNKHKTCVIKIPVKVPKGMSISLVSAEYSGNIALASNSLARLMTVFNFAGKHSEKYVVNFNGPDYQKYQLTDSLSALANIWSVCGQDTVLLVTMSTRLKATAEALTSSAGRNTTVMTRFKYRRCQR